MRFFIFFIIITSYTWGIANISWLILFRISTRQRFYTPMISSIVFLTAIVGLELLRYFSFGADYWAFTGKHLYLVFELFRIGLAASWLWIAHTQFRLNELEGFSFLFRIVLISFIAALIIILTISIIINHSLQTIINIGNSAIMIFAAISGLRVLWTDVSLHDFTKSVIRIAAVSLVIYPLVGLADILGFAYPGTPQSVPVWVSTHPYYTIIVNALLSAALTHEFKKISSKRQRDELKSSKLLDKLTKREEEIYKLLLDGKSYDEIRMELKVSKATVKTHINHIYKKANVRSRLDLIIAE